MKRRGIFSMVLVSLIVSSAFADSTSIVLNPIMDALTKVFSYVSTVLGSLIAIFLVPLAWLHISKVIWRSGRVNDEKFVSSIYSRSNSRDRLRSHGVSDKDLNTKSYRNAASSARFSKRFATFEDWQGSSNYRRTLGYY